MKVQITTTHEVKDVNDISRIGAILEAGLGSAVEINEVTEVPADPPVAEDDGGGAAKRSEAAVKAAATRAKNKRDKEAKKTTPKKVSGETTAPPVADAPKVTEGMLNKAIRAAVEAVGIDGVRSVIGGFKSKDNKPCTTLTSIKEVDYAEVVEALKAAQAE